MSVVHHFALERPDEVAIRDEDAEYGWAAVDDILNRAINGLGAMDLGAKRRVAIFAENSASTVLAHLAGCLAGCSTVPVNFHLGVDEVAYILGDSEAAVLFVSPETSERGRAAAAEAGCTQVIELSEWRGWLAEQSPAAPPESLAPRPNLMYTSGTTGRPKGVDLPPQMYPGGSSMNEWVANIQASNRFVGAGPHLVIGPLYHTGPLGAVRLLPCGVPVSVLGRFDALKTLQAIDRWKSGSSVMVPTHFVRLLALPLDVRTGYDVTSMSVVAHTGAACPVDVKRRMIEWWGPVLTDAYGSTEVGTICSVSSADWLAHPGTVGQVVPPFVRAVALDDENAELPAGVEGKLYFEDGTGRGVVYPTDPAKTAAANLRPGFFTIGEVGYVDPDGFVFITDRFSDMIVSGGVNIYPAEAEQVLIGHPQVADVAVIGVPDAEMGEAVMALVVPTDPHNPPDPSALMLYCRDHLAGYKSPRTLEIVETIGRTTMGKVNKRTLRAPYWPSDRTIG